jgi:alkylhydroperoxidase family enzyme
MAEADVARLREAGLSDRGMHDTAAIVRYFNFVNRLAEGLGVARET